MNSQHKHITYIHSRLERLERACTALGGIGRMPATRVVQRFYAGETMT